MKFKSFAIVGCFVAACGASDEAGEDSADESVQAVTVSLDTAATDVIEPSESSREEVDPWLATLPAGDSAKKELTIELDDYELIETEHPTFKIDDVVRFLGYMDASYIRSKDMGSSEANKKITQIEDIQEKRERVIIFGNEKEFKGIFVIRKDGSLVIAYRGTADLDDVLTDVNAVPVTSRWAKGRIHRGFYLDFESSWNGVFTNIAEYAKSIKLPVRDLNITLLGHSLGGAIATLAAYRLAKVSGVTNVRLVTVGSPRVLDEEAANDFDSLVGAKLRICQHGYDPVCAVGFGWMGYKHVGDVIQIGAPESYRQIHSLGGYNRIVQALNNIPLPGHEPSGWAIVHNGRYSPLQVGKRLTHWLQTSFGNIRRFLFGKRALIEDSFAPELSAP